MQLIKEFPLMILALALALFSGCEHRADLTPTIEADADIAIGVTSNAPATGVTRAVKEESPVSEPRTSKPTPSREMMLEQSPFGNLPDGREVTLFTCVNGYGLTLKLMDYGATVIAIENRDRNRSRANLTLGFNNLDGYLQNAPYFGATVGRFGNRIAGGEFTLGGSKYALSKNDGMNHLHGGKVGLNHHLWSAERIETVDSIGVKFTHTSSDGDEGYAGKLRVVASYEVNNDNELVITLTATTDKPTPVNLTNHCYWNLSGAGEGTILDHELSIHAGEYVDVNKELIPTGELLSVAETPLDFREMQKIGSRIKSLSNVPQGYDHCYVLEPGKDKLNFAARVRDPKSGRVMDVYTTQPGLQFYSGNFLDGTPASGGFQQYAGLCLESQHFPDSPNHAQFPNTILQPGDTYRHVTVHKFRTE